MEENNQNNETINTEEIKKEAVNTANQVKDTIKNSDLKKDANAAKGFVSNFFKNPIKEIETVANSKNEFLMIAIIVFAVWVIATLIGEIISVVQSYSYVSSMYMNFGTFLKNSVSNIFSIIKGVIAPILTVAVLSAVAYFMQKGNKKSFITVAISVIVAKIPVALAAIISLLNIFGSQAYKIISPITGFCGILSTVLLYFTFRGIYGEKDDNTFFKKFVIIMGIFYVVKFVFNFFGIYI